MGIGDALLLAALLFFTWPFLVVAFCLACGLFALAFPFLAVAGVVYLAVNYGVWIAVPIVVAAVVVAAVGHRSESHGNGMPTTYR